MKKPSPVGFIGFFWVLLGFIGFFLILFLMISTSKILHGSELLFFGERLINIIKLQFKVNNMINLLTFIVRNSR